MSTYIHTTQLTLLYLAGLNLKFASIFFQSSRFTFTPKRDFVPTLNTDSHPKKQDLTFGKLKKAL